MYVGRDFSPSDPSESEVYSFDFSRDLGANETISTAVWSIAVVVGTDANAANRLSGAPVNSGQITSQRVAGLLAGVVYQLRARVTTSAGNIVSLWSNVRTLTPLA